MKPASRKAPKGLHVTVCRDGGGGPPVPLVLSPDVGGGATTVLGHRVNALPNGRAARDAGTASGANGCDVGGKDGGPQVRRSGGQPSADVGAGAQGPLYGFASTAAPDWTACEAGGGPQPIREQSAGAQGIPVGHGHTTATRGAVPSGPSPAGAPRAPRNGATVAQGEVRPGNEAGGSPSICLMVGCTSLQAECPHGPGGCIWSGCVCVQAGSAPALTSGKVIAWLVSSSPHISSLGAAFASVPVQITGDSEAAGNDQSTLLLPCQALPPGAPLLLQLCACPEL